MTNNSTIRMIRELKGAPLSIVLALQCVGMRVTQAWLERATGYTDKPVSQGLAYLAEIGMVDHTRSGWGLAGGRQMVLGEENLIPQDIQDEQDDDEEGAMHQDQVQCTGETRNYSESITTTTMNHNQDNYDSAVVVINAEKVGKIPILQVFRECGIGVNARTRRLAGMPHVTEAYVRGHVGGLQQGETVGLAIFRMEQREKVPGAVVVSDEAREKKAREARHKYGQWEQDRAGG